MERKSYGLEQTNHLVNEHKILNLENLYIVIIRSWIFLRFSNIALHVF